MRVAVYEKKEGGLEFRFPSILDGRTENNGFIQYVELPDLVRAEPGIGTPVDKTSGSGNRLSDALFPPMPGEKSAWFGGDPMKELLEVDELLDEIGKKSELSNGVEWKKLKTLDKLKVVGDYLLYVMKEFKDISSSLKVPEKQKPLSAQKFVLVPTDVPDDLQNARMFGILFHSDMLYNYYKYQGSIYVVEKG